MVAVLIAAVGRDGAIADRRLKPTTKQLGTLRRTSAVATAAIVVVAVVGFLAVKATSPLTPVSDSWDDFKGGGQRRRWAVALHLGGHQPLRLLERGLGPVRGQAAGRHRRGELPGRTTCAAARAASSPITRTRSRWASCPRPGSSAHCCSLGSFGGLHRRRIARAQQPGAGGRGGRGRGRDLRLLAGARVGRLVLGVPRPNGARDSDAGDGGRARPAHGRAASPRPRPLARRGRHRRRRGAGDELRGTLARRGRGLARPGWVAKRHPGGVRRTSTTPAG